MIPSRSRKESDELESALVDFPSEHPIAVSGPEVSGFTSSFATEESSASIFPEEAIDNSGESAATEPRILVADDRKVGAKSFAPIKSYLWSLATAVVAVLVVERVTMWKGLPAPAHTPNPTVATERPTAATTSPTVTVTPAAAPGVLSASQTDGHTRAEPVALLQPAPAADSIAHAVRPQPPVQPALNSRQALIGVAPMNAPAVPGTTARAPSIEMLPPELPTPLVTETVIVPAPMPMDLVAVDKAAIDRVLGTYQESYSALDAKMVSTIWRGLDTRGLQRAFDGLNSQRMSFEHCDVIVEDDKARASCTGVLDYVRKIGQSNPLQKRLSWNFDLQRADDRWLISKVDAR